VTVIGWRGVKGWGDKGRTTGRAPASVLCEFQKSIHWRNLSFLRFRSLSHTNTHTTSVRILCPVNIRPTDRYQHNTQPAQDSNTDAINYIQKRRPNSRRAATYTIHLTATGMGLCTCIAFGTFVTDGLWDMDGG